MNPPAISLQQGTWFKLICGASFQHLSSIRDLAFLYTLAGADCVDMAADPAVVRAALAGLALAQERDPDSPLPWLMVSFNDGEDPHFRKAELKPGSLCPPLCPQPCIAVCPPHAIVGDPSLTILPDLCFGCGRCEPVCPLDLITTVGYQRQVADVMPEVLGLGIQAVEIHTQVGRQEGFAQVWRGLQPWIHRLELVSISFNDGPGLGDYLRDLVQIMDPWPRRLMWQTDGRPMSGDIGLGTTGLTLRLARKVLGLGLPGYVQLAGGTNGTTVAKMDPDLVIAGVAYGSYARQQVAPWLETGRMDPLDSPLAAAKSVVSPIKSWIRDPVRLS